MKRGFIQFCCVALLFISCRHSARMLPYYNSADFTPHFLASVPDSYHQIPPFALTAHTGRAFTEKDITGRITVANFFFTICPGICPRMTNNMKVLQDTFLKDNRIQLISHTVMPDKDNVATLQKYAADRQIHAERWLLLTGARNEIYNLGRKYYFAEKAEGAGKDSSDFLHTENFILLDGRRHIRGIYNGLNAESVTELIEDIRELEKE